MTNFYRIPIPLFRQIMLFVTEGIGYDDEVVAGWNFSIPMKK
jgi:hypothetical protein